MDKQQGSNEQNSQSIKFGKRTVIIYDSFAPVRPVASDIATLDAENAAPLPPKRGKGRPRRPSLDFKAEKKGRGRPRNTPFADHLAEDSTSIAVPISSTVEQSTSQAPGLSQHSTLPLSAIGKSVSNTWQRQDVYAMLDICDRNRDFLDDHRRLFKAIHDGMATRDCQQFDMKSIKNKYSSLRAMYRKQKLSENSSGQGPSKWYLFFLFLIVYLILFVQNKSLICFWH